MMTDQADASSRRATHQRLYAHADEPRQGAHWLAPSGTCDRPRAPAPPRLVQRQG
jgi:hypothetical protein